MDFLQNTGTGSFFPGYVASDTYDVCFRCLALLCIADGTLPRSAWLDGIGQEFDGLEGVAPICHGVSLGEFARVCGTTALLITGTIIL